MSGLIDAKEEQLEMELPSCPFLGLISDRNTNYNFASAYNVCHRCSPVLTPSLTYQKRVCLTEAHQDCIVFTHEPGKKVPPEVIGVKLVKKKLPWVLIAIGVLVVILLLLFFSMAYPVILQNLRTNPTPSATCDALNSAIIVATPLPIMESATPRSPTHTIAPTQATPTPEPSAAPPRSPHWLDVPFGQDYHFVVHRVISGESLAFLATRYNTSIESIKSLNYILYTPLWIDSIVIIPEGTIDVLELPAFEAYRVETTGIRLDQLASKLAENLDDLAYYNHLKSDSILQEDEWLILPRERRNW